MKRMLILGGPWIVIAALALWTIQFANGFLPTVLVIGLVITGFSCDARCESGTLFRQACLILFLWTVSQLHGVSGPMMAIFPAALGASTLLDNRYWIELNAETAPGNLDRKKQFIPKSIFSTFPGLIAFWSSSEGGASPMTAWFQRVWHFTLQNAELATLFFRKSVHFTFYGLFGWAVLTFALHLGRSRTFSSWIALASVLQLAAFDEIRQSSQVGRTGSAWDVLLDMTGAFAFVGLAWWRASNGEQKVHSTEAEHP